MRVTYSQVDLNMHITGGNGDDHGPLWVGTAKKDGFKSTLIRMVSFL